MLFLRVVQRDFVVMIMSSADDGGGSGNGAEGSPLFAVGNWLEEMHSTHNAIVWMNGCANSARKILKKQL